VQLLPPPEDFSTPSGGMAAAISIIDYPIDEDHHAQPIDIFYSDDTIAVRSDQTMALSSTDAMALGVQDKAISTWKPSPVEKLPSSSRTSDEYVVLHSTDELPTPNPEALNEPSAAAKALKRNRRNERKRPPLELEAGDIVSNRFELVNELGRGGDAVVFQAVDRILNRQVALKFVLNITAKSKEQDRAFEILKGEVTQMQQVRHPNIAAVYDLHLYEGMPFVSMQLLAGETLHDKLRNSRTEISFQQAVRYARQVLSGLEAAHAQGVVHRDLKPYNIMVDHHDDCTVFDFGLSKISDKTVASHDRILGTPSIMAPELIDVMTYPVRDHRVDLYAFGVTLFATLTRGKYPVHGKTSAQTLLGHLLQEPTPVTKYRPNTPKALQMIIERCLEKDPEERFSTAAEILELLDVYMDDPKRSILRLRALRNGRLMVIDPDPIRRETIANLLELSQRYVHRFDRPETAHEVLGQEALGALFISGNLDDGRIRETIELARSADPRNLAAAVIVGGASANLRRLLPEVDVLPDPVRIEDLGGLLIDLGLSKPT
jgi:serine/threonine protein kinase